MLERYISEPPNVQQRLALLFDEVQAYQAHDDLAKQTELLSQTLGTYGPESPLPYNMMTELEGLENVVSGGSHS
jgi:predicted component of type VI protein secretion system